MGPIRLLLNLMESRGMTKPTLRPAFLVVKYQAISTMDFKGARRLSSYNVHSQIRKGTGRVGYNCSQQKNSSVAEKPSKI